MQTHLFPVNDPKQAPKHDGNGSAESLGYDLGINRHAPSYARECARRTSDRGFPCALDEELPVMEATRPAKFTAGLASDELPQRANCFRAPAGKRA